MEDQPEVQAAPVAEDLEHLEKLKSDLATAQQEVENLRAAAIASTSKDVPEQTERADAATVDADQAKSISDQVAEQVKILEDQFKAQHEVSRKELDDAFNQKVTDMKKKLNDKFKELKEKVREEGRQEAIAKHSEEMQNLRSEHEAALQRLHEEHQLVVERLTKEGQAAVDKAQAKEQPVAAQPEEVQAKQEEQPQESVPAGNTTLDVTQLTFTDQQARELVGKNTIIRGIVSSNIRNKVSAETAKLKEESEKALQDKAEEAKKAIELALHEKAEEAKKEREQAVTKAVNMETMKQKAKLGMAEGQARTAKAKLDVVEKAANETPQKPVGEVWDIAKVTKAPPPTPAQAPKPVQAPSQAASSPVKPAANGIQSPSMQSPAPSSPAVQPQSTPAAQEQGPESQDKLQARAQKFGAPSVPTQAGGSVFGQPSFTPPGTSPFQTLPATQQVAQGSAGTPAVSQATAPNAAQTRPAGTGLPTARGGFGASSTGIPRGGASMLPRGGASLRGRGGIAQTGLTQPGQQNGLSMSIHGAAAQRGGMSALPRGGGAGRGRGGPARGGGQGGGQAGSSPGAINPGARPFTPGQPGAQAGNKRPHEGGDDGSGKRIRGGGGGGA